MGIINWPTCLLYPEGPTADETASSSALRLPEKWQFATALKTSGEQGRADHVRARVAGDAGRLAPDRRRAPADDPPGDRRALRRPSSTWPRKSPSALELDPEVIELYSRMVREAGALFGSCHYPEFHFLVTCSDDLGYLGLEHLASSLNGVRERDLIDDANREGWVANLIPHEYVHSWCGKFRRPAGMCTPDFHTPQKTRLLWVYEGLTEYLGEVLMVRSGLVSPKDYRETLASTIGGLMLRTGRKWRSLEDTAVASHLLRAGSPNWNELQAEPGLLLRGRAALARGRRHHPPEDPGSTEPRRLLQEVPGRIPRPTTSSPTTCRDRQAPEGDGRLRLGDVPARIA